MPRAAPDAATMKAITARRADDAHEASAGAGARCSVEWKAEAPRIGADHREAAERRLFAACCVEVARRRVRLADELLAVRLLEAGGGSPLVLAQGSGTSASKQRQRRVTNPRSRPVWTQPADRRAGRSGQ